MNYYIIVPSAASFCHHSQSTYSHSIFLISAPCLSHLIMSCLNFGKDDRKMLENEFYNHFAFSSLFPLIGNIIYAVAYGRESIWLGVIGRLMIGVHSSDVFNKQLIASKTRVNEFVVEMATLRKTQLLGIFVGLLVGAIFDINERRVIICQHLIILSFETLPAYIMVCVTRRK